VVHGDGVRQCGELNRDREENESLARGDRLVVGADPGVGVAALLEDGRLPADVIVES